MSKISQIGIFDKKNKKWNILDISTDVSNIELSQPLFGAQNLNFLFDTEINPISFSSFPIDVDLKAFLSASENGFGFKSSTVGSHNIDYYYGYDVSSYISTDLVDYSFNSTVAGSKIAGAKLFTFFKPLKKYDDYIGVDNTFFYYTCNGRILNTISAPSSSTAPLRTDNDKTLYVTDTKAIAKNLCYIYPSSIITNQQYGTTQQVNEIKDIPVKGFQFSYNQYGSIITPSTVNDRFFLLTKNSLSDKQMKLYNYRPLSSIPVSTINNITNYISFSLFDFGSIRFPISDGGD